MMRTILPALALALFAFPAVAQDAVLSAPIRAAMAEAQRAAAADGLEHAVCFDTEDRVIGTFTGTMGNVTPLCDPERTVTLVHTHPSGAGPSEGDVLTLLSPLFPHLDTSIILGADGMVTVMRGMVGRRPEDERGASFVAARYVLLNDVYRVADPAPPTTEVWPMGRLCAGLGLSCFAGSLNETIAPIPPQALAFADDPSLPAFSPILRDALASWIRGDPTATQSWADVGRLAESAALNWPYRQAVFVNDNGNFANSLSPFGSQVNLTREGSDGLESFEVFTADAVPGELDICVRTGWDLNGEIQGRLIDTTFVRLTSGQFEVRCGSRTEAGLTKTFYQRLADGQVTFFATREAMATGTDPIGSIAADTGCTQTLESIYRTCDSASPDNYARIQPD